MSIFDFFTRRPSVRYTHGHCYRNEDGCLIEKVRRDNLTGRVEFVLWKAGEQGHVEDYWHQIGIGWEAYFVAGDPT